MNSQSPRRVASRRLLIPFIAAAALLIGLDGTSGASVGSAASVPRTGTVSTVSTVTVTPAVHTFGTGSTAKIVVRDRAGHRATGKATFYLDNRIIAVVGLDATGTAARQIPAGTAIGRHNVRVLYQPAGGSSMLASHSGTGFDVTRTQVRWSIVGPVSPVYASTAAMNIHLTGSHVAPATVTLSAGGRVIARQGVHGNGDVFLRPSASWNAGRQTLVISYSGNSYSAPSVRQVIAPTSKAATTIGVSAPTTLVYLTGGSAQVQVSGAGATPGGIITLSVDGRARSSARLSAGRAALTIPVLTGGSHVLTTVYSGDANHQASSHRSTIISASSQCPVWARACVDLTHSITWLQSGGRVTYGPVAMKPGRAGYRTDDGTFTVYYKDLHHYSSTFGGAPMPYSVFFDGGIAFHEGSLTIQSHGCIHLSQSAASTYFYTLVNGDQVYVFGSAPY